MTTKQHFSQLYPVLSLASLTLCFISLDSKAFGATFKHHPSAFTGNMRGLVTENRLEQESIILSNTPNSISANNRFYLLAQSQAHPAHTLSLHSVIHSLSGLRFQGNNPSSGGADVPILPQTRFSDIYQGVYVFGPTAADSQRSQSGNSPAVGTSFFGEPISPLNGGTQGLRNFGISVLGPRGLSNSNNSISNRLSLPRPLAPVSLPSLGVDAKLLVGDLETPNLNAEFPIFPQNDLSAALEGIESGGLTELLGLLNSFGNLKVGVDLPLLPQQNLSTAATLANDYVQNSKIIGQDVNFESSLSQTLQQQQQQQQQTFRQQQTAQQQQIDQQIEEARERARLVQQELEKRYEEQLEKLMQQQKEQQQRFQEQYEAQLRSQQQQQEQLRKQLDTQLKAQR